MKIIFLGTSAFAAGILTFLLEKGYAVVAVVTKPDKPQGRSKKAIPPPVKRVTPPSIPLYQPEKASTEAFATVLREHTPDLFLVVAYGEILRQNILDIPRLGSINVHPSLLPKYRGAAPIQAALLAGDRETGVSIITVAKEMDAGDIWAIQSCPIPEEMTLPELESNLLALSCEMVDDLLPTIEAGTARPTPQDHAKATYIQKITPEKGRIDWSKSAREIHNLVRALTPKPAAWTTFEGKRLKILRTRPTSHVEGAPGTLHAFPSSGCVAICGEGALEILELQLEGKRAISGRAFAAGRRGIFELVR